MDSVTHALTGYALSCVLYDRNKFKNNKKLKALKTAVTIGAVCPDIDFVTRFAGGNVLYFMSHRTYTHSPIGILLISILCAAMIKVLNKDLKYTTLFIGTFLGALSHVLFDITNVYSTLALWPFTEKMYSLGFLSITDAFILVVLIISTVISFIKPLRLHRNKIFSAALMIIISYTAFKAYMQYSLKNYLINEYKKGSFALKSDAPKELKISVLTDYIWINSWHFIIENDSKFIKGNIKYSNHSVSSVTSVKKKTPEAAYENAAKTPLGQFLLKFTPYVDYSVNRYKQGYLVHMVDLRYTFPISVRSQQPGYSHIIGAYIVLDKNYNPISWSTKDPLEERPY